MYIALIYIRIIFKECTNRPQGASDMTKQNTSGRFFNRLLKGLCIVSAICISSLSIAVDTDNDGLPDGWTQEHEALMSEIGYLEAEILNSDFNSLTPPEDLLMRLDHLSSRLEVKGQSNLAVNRYPNLVQRIHKLENTLSLLQGEGNDGDILDKNYSPDRGFSSPPVTTPMKHPIRDGGGGAIYDGQSSIHIRELEEALRSETKLREAAERRAADLLQSNTKTASDVSTDSRVEKLLEQANKLISERALSPYAWFFSARRVFKLSKISCASLMVSNLIISIVVVVL